MAVISQTGGRFSGNQNRPESPIVGKMLIESFSMMKCQMSGKPIFCA